MLTQTEENYIKAIYHRQGDDGYPVSTKSISETLQVKAASVTDMFKQLGEHNIVV